MPGDGDLGLADADGLDQHDVVRRRLQHQHRLAVARATPPSVPARRARAGCRRPGRRTSLAIRVLSPSTEPPVRTLRRVDGEHADPVALRR